MARDIEKRTFEFAVRIIALVRSVPRSVDGGIVARQLARSGMSVGANVEEAQGSHSRKDFRRRMNIARAEAREVLYWLRLARATELTTDDKSDWLVGEADQFVRILTAIVKNTEVE